MTIEQEDQILPMLMRYLQGDAADDERKLVNDWIAESESNQTYFEEVKLIWESSEEVNDFDAINVDEEWDTFKAKTTDLSDDSSERKGNLSFLKIVASIVILLGVGMLFNNYFNNEITLVAQAGAENKFVLPDQSTVWLNEGSELVYTKDFKGNVRESQLTGEAFFEVTKNPKKPFIVNTNNTETKVLGTSFNLKTNPTTKETEIVLVTGKVQFTSKNNKKTLVPGDKIIAKSDGELVKETNQDPNFSTWKSGVLKFEETSLDKMAQDIEQFYNVKIVFENPQFGNCTLTSVFDNETIEDVLETLVVLFDITYEKIDASRILIKGGNCNS